MRHLVRLLAVAAPLALALVLALPAGHASAAVCADHPNQAAAQRAGDTRDGDGDGIFCETLPCPCASGDGPGARRDAAPAPSTPSPRACVRPGGVQNITFSATKYPHIREHFLRALRKGWPRTLVVNRRGADARRDRLLGGMPIRSNRDRDEYPPAVGRGRWRASVAYVPSSENRSHGATLGIKLRRLCDGVRFRYVFY